MINSFRFQPLVSLNDYSILGYEALCNRTDSSRLPSATDAMKYIFRDGGMQHDSLLFINMTVEDVVSQQFGRQILQIIQRMQVDPSKIVLEVSENTGPDTLQEAKQVLSLLRSYGIQIALDDFGVQYASLFYLHELPIDILKIDQSFIQASPSNRNVRAILNNVVHMAHDIGCSVVAEGIENSQQLACVHEAGADIGQGFLFTAPISSIENKRFVDINELYVYFTQKQPVSVKTYL